MTDVFNKMTLERYVRWALGAIYDIVVVDGVKKMKWKYVDGEQKLRRSISYSDTFEDSEKMTEDEIIRMLLKTNHIEIVNEEMVDRLNRSPRDLLQNLNVYVE